MAVLDDLPGVEVTVKINGLTAHEYDDPDFEDDPNRQVCKKYIESQAGAVFSISVAGAPKSRLENKYKSSRESTDVIVKIDGQKRASKFIYQSRQCSSPLEIWRFRAPSSVPGMDEIRLFKFQSITTVDDVSKARLERETESAKDIGTIQVLLYESEVVREANRTVKDFKRGCFELSEKSLKGRSISHDTDFVSGGVEPRRRRTLTRTKQLLGDFRFYYRSQKDLKSELIIPRNPSPEVVDVIADDVKNLPPAELRRLARERLAQIKGRPTPKAESYRGDKRERSPSAARRGTPAYKIVRTNDGKEAIDLTDD